VAAARNHAGLLGPPPDLTRLLGVLADGTLRTSAAAQDALAQAGAGEAADPHVLSDFTRWCGQPAPYLVLKPPRRLAHARPGYVRDGDDLRRARLAARSALRRASILTIDQILGALHHRHVRVEAGHEACDLRWILGLDGRHDWAWLPPSYSTPLTRTLHRLTAADRSAHLRDIPDLVERVVDHRAHRSPDRPRLAADALRVWIAGTPTWTLTPDEHVTPTRRQGQAVTSRADQQLLNALDHSGPRPRRRDLRQALIDHGASPSNAEAIIRHSPLLARAANGQQLIGRPLTAPQ
jgi:hypothetical protein